MFACEKEREKPSRVGKMNLRFARQVCLQVGKEKL